MHVVLIISCVVVTQARATMAQNYTRALADRCADILLDVRRTDMEELVLGKTASFTQPQNVQPFSFRHPVAPCLSKNVWCETWQPMTSVAKGSSRVSIAAEKSSKQSSKPSLEQSSTPIPKQRVLQDPSPVDDPAEEDGSIPVHFSPAETESQAPLKRDPNTLTSINKLGLLLQEQGNLEEAEKLLRQALIARRQKFGDTHPDTLSSINNLGWLLKEQGKLEEAEPLLLEALTARRKKLGDTHPSTMISIDNFGLLLQAQGRLEEAEPLLREALTARRQKIGDTHPNTMTSISNLGLLSKEQGKLEEAEKFLREALNNRRQKLGETHPDFLSSLSHYGSLLHDQGRLEEAETLLREALTVGREKLGDK